MLQQFTVNSPEVLPQEGKTTLAFDVADDRGGLGKGGKRTLSVNGRKIAEDPIDRTEPALISLEDTADVKVVDATPVVARIDEGAQSTSAV